MKKKDAICWRVFTYSIFLWKQDLVNDKKKLQYVEDGVTLYKYFAIYQSENASI